MSIKQFLAKIKEFLSSIIPEQTVESSKKKWDKLAKMNSKYVIVSKKGEEIDNEEFRALGIENYTNLVKNDPLLLGKLSNFSDKDVLEIGCGIGRMSEFFAQDFKSITGVDISEEMIKQGKARLANLTNLKLVATSGQTFPFSDENFDLVFSYLVFQNMPSKEVVEVNFREVFRVLKKGGVAKIQIRGGFQPYRWQWFYGPAFNLTEVSAMVNKIGFKIIKTTGEKEKRFWLWLEK